MAAFERLQAQPALTKAHLLHGRTLAALGYSSEAESEIRRALTLAFQIRDLALAGLCQVELAAVLSGRSDGSF